MFSSSSTRILSLFTLILTIAFASAVPWDVGSRSSISSTSGGIITHIEAMGPRHMNEIGHTRHLMGLPRGVPGNVTMKVNARVPDTFFVRKGQLYQYVNDTTIYPVNVHNVTMPRVPPLQLRAERKPDGLRGGTWRFAGSMLYYDFPGRDDDYVLKENNAEYLKYFRSQGLFYYCDFYETTSGVFMFYYLQDAGVDCHPFTLHSFVHEKKQQ
ncbi:hypothetical protein FA13DRAFT_1734102 [Coprinellus micaceus]|uniref:Uncharacterized protein n=1 Tax=Coprinellus micaceus TaxID=71717 RepID=A0A4Y7T7X5_COPMI|nr:hypothetical protein FA13DRAFT_1734102 [Coprinellus micaceus]